MLEKIGSQAAPPEHTDAVLADQIEELLREAREATADIAELQRKISSLPEESRERVEELIRLFRGSLEEIHSEIGRLWGEDTSRQVVKAEAEDGPETVH